MSIFIFFSIDFARWKVCGLPGGKCVVCPVGRVWLAGGKCVVFPVGSVWLADGKCVVCPVGSVWLVGRKCVVTLYCLYRDSLTLRFEEYLRVFIDLVFHRHKKT